MLTCSYTTIQRNGGWARARANTKHLEKENQPKRADPNYEKIIIILYNYLLLFLFGEKCMRPGHQWLKSQQQDKFIQNDRIWAAHNSVQYFPALAIWIFALCFCHPTDIFYTIHWIISENLHQPSAFLAIDIQLITSIMNDYWKLRRNEKKNTWSASNWYANNCK